MKLENIFFRSFFYPFLISVLMSMISVTYFLVKFTDNYIDKRTGKNVVDLEKKYAKININSVNKILTTLLLKIQMSLNEQILYYQKLGNRIKDLTNHKVNDYLKCLLDIDDEFLIKNREKLKYIGFWFIDNNITTETLQDDSFAKLQLIVFSNIIQNVYATLEAINTLVPYYYFMFDKTDLFINFPIEFDYLQDNLNVYTNFEDNPAWCTDSNGEVYKVYKFKCREFYVNFQKSKQKIFDMNFSDQENKTIHLTNPYKDLGQINNPNIFTMCIEFNDPISNGNAYACADIYQDNLIFSFDNLNSKLDGYFLISLVGLNKVFYYPQLDDFSRTPAENIFRWDRKFYLKEKTDFINNVQNLITSNYKKYLIGNNNVFYDEIKINGVNTSEQYFYFNGEKFYFSLFPVVLENIKGYSEHILSIVYFYNNNLYYDKLKSYQSNSNIKIILEILLFAIFGSGLLYLIVLTFNTLAKYIVIPIKNVNYMLKGIHIGGENRIDYLDFLKIKQSENLEKLEKIYFYKDKKNKNEMNDYNSIDNNDNDNKLDDFKEEYHLNKNNDIIQQNMKNLNDFEFNGEIINPKEDYNKKYDKESDYIEKEINFYDFDEELLQYRPLEIDRLVKVLLNLKGALLVTSSNNQIEKIINYSYSEGIFRNFKNKEGASICQSNIGNLQSQLLKYDKAIYHLALSLQDDKLKRFLSRVLSDELDESDVLLQKIYITYNKDKNKEKENKLVEKQQNNSHNNFSQKRIGMLINSRYCKLINVYFKFFSVIKKSNIEVLSGQFMNTNFHTINYYHKILIQYIYLSYMKNDLVKIGESILDYIEFLIKFKFKLSLHNRYILNIHNRDHPEYKEKQNYKKKIFDKIMKWFNLFDSYASHVNDNSLLGDEKSIVDDMNLENNDINLGSHSVFLFKVNIQRGDFLKGKLAFACQNYKDALFFFILASKKKSIVLDGLIQKKSLKYINKITNIIYKKLENYGIINSLMNKSFIEYDKIKHKKTNNKTNLVNKEDEDKKTFKDEIKMIKDEILNDINECNDKQSKDIIILIDFNLYENGLNIKNNIDSFIDQTNLILNNYLTNNDKLGVFIYTKGHKIICPLMYKKNIDISGFTKDLLNFKKKIYNEYSETDELNTKKNDLQNEKIKIQSNIENNTESNYEFDSFDEEDIRTKNIKLFSGLLNSIIYIKNYFRIKQAFKNEKYLILFTFLFSYFQINDKEIVKKIEELPIDKDINFILVGKNKFKIVNNTKESNCEENLEERMKDIIKEKFGSFSSLIDFDNMKKIKTIFSNNHNIKDEIIFPNEIYKY
mgnify:CR=1 FL=1